MEIYIGKDVLKPEYYERRKSWFIRRNKNEAVFTDNNVWLEFETKEEAEEYLLSVADYYGENCIVIPSK